MKIAVCISGVPRSGVGAHQEQNRDFKRNYNNIQKNFPGADIYLGTWKQHEKELKKEFPDKPYWLFDEPNAHYHPYLDVPPAEMPTDNMREVAGIYRSRKNLHERTLHQTKQILCHANMVRNLPEEYDVIIRARFDTFTCAQVDFSAYVNEVYTNKTTIGFACIKPHWQTFNRAVEMTSDNKETARFVDKHLFDSLIMHHGTHIDPDYIFKLFENKKLLPAEFGWYQTLSEPYNNNHRCISGWVNADRCVLTQFLVNK